MKTNKRIPRYTSYPIYPRWNDKLELDDLVDQIQRVEATELYIHIPFCTKPCFYCGCNKIIAKQGTRDDEYIDALLKEWELYKKINPDLFIKSIHFGGGTPTFLSEMNISKLLKHLDLNKETSISVEVDPRVTTKEQLALFKKYGANRVSMGIQDFDEGVQKLINRKQPPKLVREITDILRELGINDINFDLIYGLPNQSLETIDYTLEQVVLMKPQTISLFSYAHIPEQFPLQKRLTEYLPSDENKDAFYQYYRQRLIEMGYHQIGLDHFALEDSFLYQSFKHQVMRRSFMGYVNEKLENQIGLGVSAISDLKGCFYQNEKSLEDYYKRINEGSFPISYSHTKSHEDILISTIIERLMCYKSADLKELISNFQPSKALEFLSKLKSLSAKEELFQVENGVLNMKSNELHLRQVCFEIDNLVRSIA